MVGFGWFGQVWLGLVGLVRFGWVCSGKVGFDQVWSGLVEFVRVRLDLIWFGLVWSGLVRLGLVGFGRVVEFGWGWSG